MTAEEVRTYLKSYRNLKDKADYLQNKLINVKAISYRDSPTGSYSEPKTQNDYILMKDRCLEEMALIRQNIDKLDDINHRDVLFYRYIELMSIYDTADLVIVSNKHLSKNKIERNGNDSYDNLYKIDIITKHARIKKSSRSIDEGRDLIFSLQETFVR